MEQVKDTLKQTIKNLYNLDFEPEITPAPENLDADYSTNAPLKLAKELHKPPMEIAETLLTGLEDVFSDSRACSPSRSSRRQNEPPVKTGGRVGSRVEDSSNANDFDWGGFLKKIKDTNDAVARQLLKTTYEFENGVLKIYPEKKIVKTILSSKNNKQLLASIASGIKIEIMEVGKKEIKDPTIAKISDIMGGEVKNDGGENPF